MTPRIHPSHESDQLHTQRIAWLAVVAAGCLDLGDAAPASSHPPRRAAGADGARDEVRAWQSAALDLEAGGPAPLVALVAMPFEFVSGQVRGFEAATPAEVRGGFADRERQAVLHTSALVARASAAEPRWESTRRGEIRAELGGDRGYALTVRRRPDGAWRVIRFEVRAARPSE